ncbi:MAG: aminomethyl-transferring glycine dehydrogenase subunit GcvPB [Candidatus Thermoplasmatota archaeon]|nr:aminomethyl-transferring glycine dehydrogenase subunit GcvPB [Candidatus Thermoplasmatota archaeon]
MASSEFRQARYKEKLIFELAQQSEVLPLPDDIKNSLPSSLISATAPKIPQIPEAQLVRHYTRLSQMNYCVDTGFYPLGSCTMKYTPKFLEEFASSEKFASLHPYQSEDSAQSALRILYELQNLLCKISGMQATTLQPAAGAHGELTGLLMVKAYHKFNNEDRTEVIIPDTAHGTNPASARMAGLEIINLNSKNGLIDLEALEKAVSEKSACLMLTNPNTLGIFEKDVVEIAKILHDKGALLYYDGANFNAIFGKTTPGKMGCDLVHFNLHKTFGAPHGGGGPGAGPVSVTKELARFLPTPVVEYNKNSKKYYLDYSIPHSIGKVKMFYGNFQVLLKAYLYIRLLGSNGLREVTDYAVLNSNYLLKKLKYILELPFEKVPRLHEFVLSAKNLKSKNIRALDLAKALLDYGLHAPTIYFPSVVEEALMIEATETEHKSELDKFVEALSEIVKIAVPNYIPKNTSVGRVDEVKAARNAIISWKDCRNL